MKKIGRYVSGSNDGCKAFESAQSSERRPETGALRDLRTVRNEAADFAQASARTARTFACPSRAVS